jgi:hypothetical protein
MLEAYHIHYPQRMKKKFSSKKIPILISTTTFLPSGLPNQQLGVKVLGTVCTLQVVFFPLVP